MDPITVRAQNWQLSNMADSLRAGIYEARCIYCIPELNK